MLNLFRHIWSYVLGLRLQEFDSAVSGRLELWLINGKKVLNSAHANYSFDSLHRVFQGAFRKKGLALHADADVLILGFGCGSVAHILLREYEFDCRIVGVDLDPLMFELAEKHFHLQASDKLRFVVADAEIYVRQNQAQFDLVVVDLFVDDQVPDIFTSVAFVSALPRLLKRGGQLFMNVIHTHAKGKAQLDAILDAMGVAEVIYLPDGNAVIYFRN